MDIRRLLSKLTVEEKAALVSGTDFMYTNIVPRLGIPSLHMSDGPHGLRVQTEGGDNGVTSSLPATAFPTAATVASGWNPENSYRIGRAIGKEAHKYGIHVVLGPGANIKRNPTAGRNFEYFSEDPYLAGKMAAAEVNGIQSEGVGVSVKHFALNNSENYRFMGESIADMRAIREIYLKVFEIVVKESHPATMMCAYNKINGVYCCENKWLLTDVLRREWGFDGLVMTDWGAMHDRVKSLQTGLDLEMPGDTNICRRWILDGVKDGTLAMEDLDRCVANILRVIEKYAKKMADDCDFEANDRLACEIAEDNHADLTGVKIERQAERAVLEGQQLVGHATRQSRHVRNAVAGRRDIAHFLGGGVTRLVRLDEIIERLAYRGGINGKFCHDHSLLLENFMSGSVAACGAARNRIVRLSPLPCGAAAGAGRPRCCP